VRVGAQRRAIRFLRLGEAPLPPEPVARAHHLRRRSRPRGHGRRQGAGAGAEQERRQERAHAAQSTGGRL
jgi:hypothetical protein